MILEESDLILISDETYENQIEEENTVVIQEEVEETTTEIPSNNETTTSNQTNTKAKTQSSETSSTTATTSSGSQVETTSKQQSTSQVEETITQTQTSTETAYWCTDGGTHHVAEDDVNEHGYYSTWDLAWSACQEYMKNLDNFCHYKVDQCWCGLYYFWVEEN